MKISSILFVALLCFAVQSTSFANSPADSDGDGVNDYREGKDGTDPNNAASFDPLSKGLVVLYTFNGTFQSNAGLGADAIPRNSVNFVPDNKFGTVAKVQGADSVGDSGGHIELPEPALLSKTTFSASFWIKEHGFSYQHGETYLLAGSGLKSRTLLGNFGNYDTTPKFLGTGYDLKGSGSSFEVNPATVTEIWNHYVISETNGQSIVYRNGSQIYAVSTSGEPVGNWFIGRHWWGGGGYLERSSRLIASVANLRIYNRALSATEVSQLYAKESGTNDFDNDGVNDYREGKDGTDPNNASSFNPLSKGLVAFYPFDGNAKDESGHGRDGEVIAGTFGSDRNGVAGQAFESQNTSHYAKLPISSKLLNGDYTISTFAKFNNPSIHYPHLFFGENSFIVLHGLGPAYGNLAGGVSLLEYSVYNSARDWIRRSELFSKQKLNPGNWHHICITRSNGEVILYINGQFDHKVVSNNSNLLEGNFIQAGLGYLNDYHQSLRGAMDESRFYNRALSPAEILQLYAKESRHSEMITVQGGTLPSSSQLAGQKVDTFQIGKYEVTWGEWKTVRDWAVANGYTDLANVGAGSGDDHPVRNVSWYDVVKWCNAKSEMEGLVQVYQVNGSTFKNGEGLVSFNLSGAGYRLPRESEWEWAARGGNSSKGYVYSGGDNLYSVGWFKLNAKNSSLDLGKIVLDKYRDDFEKLSLENKNKLLGTGTWPVGEKNANELGIYDMSGNVWEWCWEQQVNNDTDITRRKRGGSWYNYDYTANLVSRWAAYASRKNEFSDPLQHNLESQGFRLARNSGTPDTIAPAISIASISANARLTSANATFGGTITETGSKPTLQYRLGTTGNWTASTVGGSSSPYSFSQVVALKPGPNTVQFQAKDDAGNTSALASINVSYVVASTLTIPAPNAADGSVTSGFGGSTSREVGVRYTVTATPASGMLFKEWLKNGTRISTNATLSFMMEPGLKLVPVFVPDYAKLGGFYNGLVGTGEMGGGTAADRQAFAARNGFLQIRMGSAGALSGFLRIEGGSHPFSGSMGNNKKATITVARPGETNAVLNLNLVSALPGEISGTVGVGGVSVPFKALRGGNTPGVAKHALGGKRYALVFPPPEGVAMGHGHGTLTVGDDGSAVLAGVLANGQAVNAGARVVDDGKGNWVVPVYVGGTGIFTGEIVIPKTAPASGSEIGGSLEWLKPASNRGLFRQGFLKAVQPLGTSHNATSAGLGGAEFQLTLDPAKRILPAAVVQNGSWPNGAAPILATPVKSGLTITFNSLSGRFEGRFNRTVAGATVPTPFQGTLFSRAITLPGGKVLRGAGFFTSGNASTAVEITSDGTAEPSANMVTVQGGTLPMGSELAGQTVSTFQIGKYEVTWDEWKEVREWAVKNGYPDLANVGAGSAGNHPVQYVNWYDVVKWINARSEKEGLVPVYQVSGAVYKTGQSEPTVNSNANGYRLPLEKESEWAARGGISSKGYYYSGSNDLDSVAWYMDSGQVQAVGGKLSNELGIHDMSGNIWEWVWDIYEPVPAHRRFRSGCWNPYAGSGSVSFRDGNSPPIGSVYWLGFRLARNAGN